MTFEIFRHGATPGNRLRRYIGSTDEPVCTGELERITPVGGVTRVYISPMLRARQTAERLFPGAELVEIADFREMDFGVFENRSADEMSDDPLYREWVDGMCEGCCPGGESKDEFVYRSCAAFGRIAAEALASGAERLVVVAHGGTAMSILSRYAEPPRGYYEWGLGNLESWTAELSMRDGVPVLVGCVKCAKRETEV